MRYFDTGADSRQSDVPVIVLANGLGGPASAWAPYLSRWRGRFRMISWDYRGCYGSVLAHPGADLSVAAHARDLRDVLNHMGIGQVSYLGWSMGVQVGLEFYSQNPTRVSDLTLVSGTYGRPFRSVPLPWAELALGPLVHRAQHVRALGTILLSQLSRSKLSYPALTRLGLLAPDLTKARYQAMIDDAQMIDLKVFFRLLEQLGKHNAEAALRQVQVRALVIAGSKDVLTPPWVARRIRSLQSAASSAVWILGRYSTTERSSARSCS